MDSKAGDLFTAEDAHPTGTGGAVAPKGFSASMAKEWIEQASSVHSTLASFVDQRKFSKPRNFGEFCQRVVKNVEVYNSNYTFIFWVSSSTACKVTKEFMLFCLDSEMFSPTSKLVVLGE
uniref:PRA1 family protein n=1 Tax=Amphiprion percula TaxID=161767 RepID=A0A3P8SQM8_AMPPE